MGIAKALGSDRQGKLALWQVIARVIDQGSHLSAVRLAGSHAACDILGLDGFHEEHLQANLDLAEHPRAKVEVALRKVCAEINKLKLAEWLTASASDRTIVLVEDAAALAEVPKLDGCYVLKTDLTPRQASKRTMHGRYKDLALVEWAFRTSKTMQLEGRPIHVWLAPRTRGHVLIVMLAYRIVAELSQLCWHRGRWT